MASMPPAITVSTSPMAMSRTANPTAVMEEQQARSRVSEGICAGKRAGHRVAAGELDLDLALGLGGAASRLHDVARPAHHEADLPRRQRAQIFR